MPTKADTPTISTSAARWLIFTGVCLTFLGIAVAALLEWDDRPIGMMRTGAVWNFLENTFFLAVLLGLAITLVGSLTWAWRVPVRKIVWRGIEIVIFAPIVLAVVPINVHGSLAVLMISVAGVMLIGVLLLIVAAIRTFSRRDRGAIAN